jgi:hypothetical protein
VSARGSIEPSAWHSCTVASTTPVEEAAREALAA